MKTAAVIGVFVTVDSWVNLYSVPPATATLDFTSMPDGAEFPPERRNAEIGEALRLRSRGSFPNEIGRTKAEPKAMFRWKITPEPRRVEGAPDAKAAA
mmetsp:Transcript_22094/g.45020  ORF Transcript_22094/g.45020 Transcript_22094/m.45020 type:complete len:98 (+) Transcript_22094:527-820(+)